MDVNELYYAMQAVNTDTEIDEENKKIRLEILQALVNNFSIKNKLHEMMDLIIESGRKLEKDSNYAFFIQEDFEKTRIMTKGYILESRLIPLLNSQGITEFTFDELKNYLNQYISSTGDTIDDLTEAVKLYIMLEEYKNSYNNMYVKVKEDFTNIFGEELLSNNGDLKFKYDSLLDRIKRMSMIGVIDEQLREWTELMFNQLFTYYLDSKLVIPLETQIDVSGTKELIN